MCVCPSLLSVSCCLLFPNQGHCVQKGDLHQRSPRFLQNIKFCLYLTFLEQFFSVYIGCFAKSISISKIRTFFPVGVNPGVPFLQLHRNNSRLFFFFSTKHFVKESFFPFLLGKMIFFSQIITLIFEEKAIPLMLNKAYLQLL